MLDESRLWLRMGARGIVAVWCDLLSDSTRCAEREGVRFGALPNDVQSISIEIRIVILDLKNDLICNKYLN